MKAKTHLSQAKSRGGFTLVEMLVVIGMIAALAGISLPVYKSIQKKVEKQQLEMILSSLERAVDNFETEYNYLPYVGAAYPAPEPLNTGFRMGDLMTVLVGGYTAANTANFKRITFFDSEEPKGGPDNYTDGLLITGTGPTKTAALYTPWGGEYDYFTMDYDGDGEYWLPYTMSDTTSVLAPVIILDPGADNTFFTDDDFCTCGVCVVCSD